MKEAEDKVATLPEIYAAFKAMSSQLVASVEVEHGRLAELVNACGELRSTIRTLAEWKRKHGPNCLGEGLLQSRADRINELAVFNQQREAADLRIMAALDALVAPAEPAKPALAIV